MLTTRRVLVSAGLLGAGTAALLAGPLDPPAGPVGPTYKTLGEVEPRIAVNATTTPGDADSLFKITQPGSYYLTGNLTGVAGKHGIEIAATGVTLDLMGFELLGVPGSLDGVCATVGLNHVQVRNGSVRSWGDEGLDFTNGGSIAVTDVSVSSCAGFGISINPNSSATRCKASFNGAGGIATGINCVVSNCTVQGNTGGGILAWVGCTVVDCAATSNTGNGISANNASTVTGCTASDNTAHGFSVGLGCTVAHCSASFNDVHGFAGLDGVTMSGCAARNNFGNGINLGVAATVTDCTATQNSGDGINVDAGARVSACNASTNLGDGIEVNTDSYIVANQCNGNGAGAANGAGIHVWNPDNRIEANSVSDNDRGLLVDRAGNFIVRNTASNNTINYEIFATNYGQYVNALNGPAVSGNTGGNPIGTTDPWVNLSF